MLSRKQRAKIFLPFDALNGMQEALRKKEIQYEDKKELSEDSFYELEKEFNKIEKGSNIKITYYKSKRYIDSSGIVTNINYIKKKIQINETENINICDILKLKLMN